MVSGMRMSPLPYFSPENRELNSIDKLLPTKGYQMPEPRVPEDTFRLEIKGCPKNQPEAEALQWAMINATFIGTTPDDFSTELTPTPHPTQQEVLDAYRFNLPYQQGGGFVEITKVPEDNDEAKNFCGQEGEDGPWGFRTEEVTENGWIYTGWILTDHYTDSMTGIFVSPVFRTPADTEGVSQFAVWEY